MVWLATFITGELSRVELIRYSLLIAVVGITVVFLSLFVIIVFVLAFTKWMRIYENYKKYLENKKRRARKRALSSSKPVPRREEEEGVDEIAAVVAAAYAFLSTGGSSGAVRRLRLKKGELSEWQKVGMEENFEVDHRDEINNGEEDE